MNTVGPCTVHAWWSRLGMGALCLFAGLGAGVMYSKVARAADGSTSTPPHTVTWYADNPQTRARVELLCLDNPGQLGSNADCINAHQAAIVLAAREARARTAPLNPNSPGFWSADPEARQNKLLMCGRNPGLQFCDVAKRSLVTEAGNQQR
jgi:hypothetical protein